MTLMLQCDIICIHFHTLYLCAKPMKVPKKGVPVLSNIYLEHCSEVSFVRGSGGTLITSSVVPTTLQRSVISPHVFC